MVQALTMPKPFLNFVVDLDSVNNISMVESTDGHYGDSPFTEEEDY